MKNILNIALITIIAFIFFSCSGERKQDFTIKYLDVNEKIFTNGKSFTFSPNNGQSVDVRELQIGGHSYIVATSIQLSGSRRPGGVSIIHSAGCSCIKK